MREGGAPLSETERMVLSHRFGVLDGGEPMTLDAIGKILGVSRERVRQIQKKALDKIGIAGTRI